MRISIADRLHPFSHLPGISAILPGWGYQVQVFPCLIRIYCLKKTLPFLLTELSLELKGPIHQFTVSNDLEKGKITVSGWTAEGWLRYHMISSQLQEGVRLFVERTPKGGVSISQEQERHSLHDKEWMDLLGKNLSFQPYQIPACDRLSLGNHKSQDWELVKRRLNLAEIFPILHRLGQLVPLTTSQRSKEGTLSLLEACRRSFDEDKPEEAPQTWQNLILGGFKSMLVPQLEDSDYQGFVSPHHFLSSDISPLVLLTEGSRLIRHLFFQQEKDKISILPFLLPCLPCGRLLDVPLEGGGAISFEWTKKTIRRLILYVEQDQELTVKFRSHVRSYRLRQDIKDKGESRSCQTPLSLKKNHHYFFDNFK